MTWWHEFISKEMVVYDIGANVGEFTVDVAPLCLRVYAFEPNPLCFDELLKNTAKFRNVTPERIALADYRGDIPVFTYRNWTLLPECAHDPRSGDRDYHPGQRTELKCDFLAHFETLDDLTLRFQIPEFIKIDVDGGEGAVLRGAKETLETVRPALYVEIGRTTMAQFNERPEELLDYLSLHRYTFVIDDHAYPRWVSRDRLLSMIPESEVSPNVLCLPEEDTRLRKPRPWIYEQ